MIKFIRTLCHVVITYNDRMHFIKKELEEIRLQQREILREQTANIHMRDAQARFLEKKIAEATQYIKDRTELSADLSPSAHKYRGTNTVIVAGRYKNNDFVEVYSLNVDHFRDVVATLQERSKYGELHIVDAAPHVSAFIKREIKDGQ